MSHLLCLRMCFQSACGESNVHRAVREHANMHTGCGLKWWHLPTAAGEGKQKHTRDHFHTSQADRGHAHLLCSMWPEEEKRLHRISEWMTLQPFGGSEELTHWKTREEHIQITTTKLLKHMQVPITVHPHISGRVYVCCSPSAEQRFNLCVNHSVYT